MNARFKKVGLPAKLAKFATANGFVHIVGQDERGPDVMEIEVPAAGLPDDLKRCAISRSHRGYLFFVRRPHTVLATADQIGGEPAPRFLPDPKLKIQAGNEALEKQEPSQGYAKRAPSAPHSPPDTDDDPST